MTYTQQQHLTLVTFWYASIFPWFPSLSLSLSVFPSLSLSSDPRFFIQKKTNKPATHQTNLLLSLFLHRHWPSLFYFLDLVTYYIFLDTVSVGPAPSPNGFLLFSLLPAHDGLFYLVTFQEGTSFVSVCVRVCACVSLNLFVSRHFSTCVCVCVCVCVCCSFFPHFSAKLHC